MSPNNIFQFHYMSRPKLGKELYIYIYGYLPHILVSDAFFKMDVNQHQ